MTTDDIKAARKTLGVTQARLAAMLGYQGDNLKQTGYALEHGNLRLREPQRLLLQLYLRDDKHHDALNQMVIAAKKMDLTLIHDAFGTDDDMTEFDYALQHAEKILDQPNMTQPT